MSDSDSPAEDAPQDFGRLGFAKTFVFPAFWLFLIPAVSLGFFMNARMQFDDEIRQALISQVKADGSIPIEDRPAIMAGIENIYIPAIIDSPEFGEMDGSFGFDYAQIRWCILFAVICLVSAVVMMVLGGVSVLLSLWSQTIQLYSLAAGWHILRIFGAIQTLLQATLLVGLSYWVTALWFNIYIPKLIIVAVLLAAAAVYYVITAIFKRPNMDFAVEGDVIDSATAMPLWNELRAISDKVGTEPPDQIIAGIDDAFFVTEQPITVGKRTVTGRSLYVSLSLLKQLDGHEADAVMAHEMAHFSGNDTVYSKKIAPMMARFDNYLAALYSGVVTIPVFYFMLMFRGLYELSLGRQSRQREFRADGIAASVASPESLASSLLRIIAYAKYRGKVEQELFEQEQSLVTANIANRIEKGFSSFAAEFVGDKEIETLSTSHPFDSHPPLEQRLDAVGVSAEHPDLNLAMQTAGDGRWYHNLTDAAELEKRQWSEYEDRFRTIHEQSLCYRYLPSTEGERDVVVRHFPPVSYSCKKGELSVNIDEISFDNWAEPIPINQIANMSVDDGVLYFTRTNSVGKKHKAVKLKLGLFGKRADTVLNTINNYFGRYKMAEAYVNQAE